MDMQGRSPAAPATRRPISLTLVGWLFVVVALVGTSWVLLPGLWGEPARPDGALLPADGWYVLITQVVAFAGGALLLAGIEEGRWVLVAWLAAHVWLTVGGDVARLATHVAMFVVITWLLFRPAATAWLKRPARAGEPAPIATDAGLLAAAVRASSGRLASRRAPHC